MWIFTETGFVSAVKKPQDNGLVSVRARDRVSLQPLEELTGSSIIKTPDGDYPYRLFVEQEVFAAWVTKAALDIDYANFKSRMGKLRDYNYLGALHDVWLAMTHVEDAAARNLDEEGER